MNKCPGVRLTSGNQFITAVPQAIHASPCGHGVTYEAEDGCDENCCIHVVRFLCSRFLDKYVSCELLLGGRWKEKRSRRRRGIRRRKRRHLYLKAWSRHTRPGGYAAKGCRACHPTATCAECIRRLPHAARHGYETHYPMRRLGGVGCLILWSTNCA